MAGLVKAKKFLWKDSNLEFFGSNTEKQVSSESRIVFKLYRRDGIEFTCEFRSMPFTELPNAGYQTLLNRPHGRRYPNFWD